MSSRAGNETRRCCRRRRRQRGLPLVAVVVISLLGLWFASVTVVGVRAIRSPATGPAAAAATTTTMAASVPRGGGDDDVDDPSAAASSSSSSSSSPFREMHATILRRRDSKDGAFLAALDQSGGSTPRALEAYGMGPSVGSYEIGTESMFDAVHAMRTRIMTSDCFTGDSILGAILFEDTMDRTVEGLPTSRYLWETKGIVPFLKIDKGLRTIEARDVPGEGVSIEEEPGTSSVQLLAPIPNLESLLRRAKAEGVYGTKARSVILDPKNPDHIDALVKQQFQLARRVLREGLIPVVEPEVDVTQDPDDKRACEEILCAALLRELDALRDEDDLVVEHDHGDDDDGRRGDDARTLLGESNHKVMIKISLPERPDQYGECVDHPCCLRVVALSGGYDRTEANARLSRSPGVIASFSRALAEGLEHGMTRDDFEARLGASIAGIYEASASP